jgi:hypothetical protein
MKNLKTHLTGVTFTMLSLFATAQPTEMKPLHRQLGDASVIVEKDHITVKTGRFQRSWILTTAGLKTISIKGADGVEYAGNYAEHPCDWKYDGLFNKDTKAEVKAVTINESDDQGFTGKHLELAVELTYPSSLAAIRYVVWVYPNAPGVRTQLSIKAPRQERGTTTDVPGTVQFKTLKGSRKAGGYKEKGKLPSWWLVGTVDPGEVAIGLSGLKPEKKYKLHAALVNMDGEISAAEISALGSSSGKKSILQENVTISGLQNPDKFQELTIDLPTPLYTDGKCVISFKKTDGAVVTVNELAVFEQSDSYYPIRTINPERYAALTQQMPQGYTLKGYSECDDNKTAAHYTPAGSVDYIPLSRNAFSYQFAGYFADTQHRNSQNTPILLEKSYQEAIPAGFINNWASLVMVQGKQGGLAIVKESHKCANQYGVDTGGFEFQDNGIAVSGTSVLPAALSPDKFISCWATWTIAYSGQAFEGQLALKEFDRFRYPVVPERDIYTQANTWGTAYRKGAMEANVLKEIASTKELGIDYLQIDDGWQVPPGSSTWNPGTNGWKPHPEVYPQGWTNVRKAAKEAGVTLGLWAAAEPVSLDELKWNYEHGGFLSYKLDFASLSDRSRIESIMGKARDFVLHTAHKVKINWDLTEIEPRYGYFWAKEYGSIYLANRKPDHPYYIPYLVLRDAWHLSKYININKIQTTVQNVRLVNPNGSDAVKHCQEYALGIGMTGTPLFFQETYKYEGVDRNTVAKVMERYKQHRDHIYHSFAFPVGEEPNNKTWSGIQYIKPGSKTGYLYLFRELLNTQQSKEIRLEKLAGKTIEFKEILSGKSWIGSADKNGSVKFTIPEPATFMFIQYKEH